jgi:predicted Zn-dependent peptidase
LGGNGQNATTYFYRTDFFENIPSDHLEALMDMESDRMHNLKLTTEVIEKEKGAVVGELRRALDVPARMAWDELMRLMFNTAPYRWTVLGTEEEIKGFTLEEAEYYYRTYYAPNNATLIVIGDTDEKELLPLAVKYYGGMKSQTVPNHVPKPEPEQTEAREYDGTHRQATSETVMLGYHIPTVIAPDFVPLSLLSTHLSRGMEARLRKILVDKGIAVSASASTSSKPDVFEFSVQMAEGHHADEALKIIDKEIVSLQKHRISKPDLERALNQELLSLYSDINDNSELGNWLGEYMMLCGNYMRGFEIIDGYKSTTAADLQRVAKDYLKPQNRSTVIIRPEVVKHS